MPNRLTPDDPAFDRLFTGIQDSWFRLETLQHYDVSYEQEAFDAFQAGRPIPLDPGEAEWTDLIQQHVRHGRRLRRVHIITEPLTPYIKYELAYGYRAGLAGGEDIRLVATRQGEWLPNLPQNHDFWFLDNDLWIMHYDQDGKLLFAEHETDPRSVAEHQRWMESALDQSITLDEYRQRTQSPADLERSV